MTMADRATPVSGPRIVMLLLDGASLEYIWPRAAGGRLPNFARLLETGASMDLATVRPTGPDPVWAAVATGMYPAKNGVRSPAVYYVRGDTRPLRSAARSLLLARARASRASAPRTELPRDRSARGRSGASSATPASPPASCAGR